MNVACVCPCTQSLSLSNEPRYPLNNHNSSSFHQPSDHSTVHLRAELIIYFIPLPFTFFSSCILSTIPYHLTYHYFANGIPSLLPTISTPKYLCLCHLHLTSSLLSLSTSLIHTFFYQPLILQSTNIYNQPCLHTYHL